MSLTSFQFLFFFLIVYLAYLILNHQWQNKLLLAASCFFYALWDWRFLSLIFISITTDYICGLRIFSSQNEKTRKKYLLASIFINIGILCLFKYFNFFAFNLKTLLGCFSLNIHPAVLKIGLPIGISFYTLKTLSYTFDVYTNKIQPTRSYRDYALFVIFFPLLLAGPIVRAGDFLPQAASMRKITPNNFYQGCYLIFWGMFEKIFIADNLAKIVNPVFAASPPYAGAGVLLGLYAFAFQLFCDFDGYSNMARGLSRCMGFDIMANFNLPYFAANPAEFWKRWHISLSAWLHDYLYVPLAFSARKWGSAGVFFALTVTFILCGLWHGADWHFVLWGFYYALLLILYTLLRPYSWIPSRIKNKFLAGAGRFLKVILFFHLICLGWLFFRADNTAQIMGMLNALFTKFSMVSIYGIRGALISFAGFISILLIVQYFQFTRNNLLIVLEANPLIRRLFYLLCYCLLLVFGATTQQRFIYFKF